MEKMLSQEFYGKDLKNMSPFPQNRNSQENDGEQDPED